MIIKIKNLLSKSNSFLIFLLIYIIYIIYISIKIDDEKLFISITISATDFLILIFFIKKTNLIKYIFLKIYFLYRYTTIVLPIIYISLFYSNKEIEQYLISFEVTSFDVMIANCYIFIYNLLLLIFLFIFLNLPYKFNHNYLKKYFISFHKRYIVLFSIIIIAYIAKAYLIYTHLWFIFLQVDSLNYKFANLFNILEKLDIIVLFYYAYIMKYKQLTLFDKFFIITILIISTSLAIISGSKARVLIIFIPILFIILNSKYRNIYLSLAFVLIFMMASFFKFMMFNRLHNEYSIYQNLKSFYMQNKNTNDKERDINKNTILRRLNYQIVFAMVIRTYPIFPQEYKTIYFDNLTGLIPRFIWDNRGEIGLNGNIIGREIGFIGYTDYITAVGIRPIGESYYQIGIIGIFVVPIVIALLISIIVKLLDERYWIGFLLSIMLSIQFSLMDNYSTIIPILIKNFIIFYLFAILLNNKFVGNEKKYYVTWRKK